MTQLLRSGTSAWAVWSITIRTMLTDERRMVSFPYVLGGFSVKRMTVFRCVATGNYYRSFVVIVGGIRTSVISGKDARKINTSNRFRYRLCGSGYFAVGGWNDFHRFARCSGALHTPFLKRSVAWSATYAWHMSPSTSIAEGSSP